MRCRPIIQPIRGGTTARIFLHGRALPIFPPATITTAGPEYIPVQSLTKMVDVMLRVVEKVQRGEISPP